MTVKRLTRMAVLTAAALAIFIAEAQIPIPVRGVKLGLANIVTLLALFSDRRSGLGTRDALMILLGRIIISALFSGRVISFVYSATGGLLCFAAMALLRRFLSGRQVWVCGVIGAVFHNIGQIAAAVALTGTVQIAAYLPLLIAAGVVTGLFTGLVTQFALAGMRGIKRFDDY